VQFPPALFAKTFKRGAPFGSGVFEIIKQHPERFGFQFSDRRVINQTALRRLLHFRLKFL